ncbi:MAG: hypothetical protein J6A47_10155, partial [Bacilli bacterium]|nr:hypothetical protein [Bacilli bacterium]
MNAIQRAAGAPGRAFALVAQSPRIHQVEARDQKSIAKKAAKIELFCYRFPKKRRWQSSKGILMKHT